MIEMTEMMDFDNFLYRPIDMSLGLVLGLERGLRNSLIFVIFIIGAGFLRHPFVSSLILAGLRPPAPRPG